MSADAPIPPEFDGNRGRGPTREDAEARVAALAAPAPQEIEDAVLTEPAPIAQGEA